MRWLFFTLLVLLFLIAVPYFYLQNREFPARPQGFVPGEALGREEQYRAEKLEAVANALPEEARPRFRAELAPLRTPLPREENNGKVEELAGALERAGYKEAAETLRSLSISWEPDPARVEAGRILYQNRCMTCHGRGGDGVPVTPEGLKRDSGSPIYPRDFTGKYHKEGKVVFKYTHRGIGKDLAYLQDLRLTIREGLPGTPMPGFPELKEQEVEALLEYIRSLAAWQWKYFPAHVTFPEPVPPQDLRSEVRVARGRALFSGVCAACHGNLEAGGEPLKGLTLEWYAYNEKGEILRDAQGNPVFQGIAPRNFLKEPLSRPGPKGIYTTIRYGLGGTPMAGFAFPDEQIWDLVSYILWLREKNHATP